MTSYEHEVSDDLDVIMSSVRFIRAAAYHIDIDNQWGMQPPLRHNERSCSGTFHFDFLLLSCDCHVVML